jgi:hypothetical protein
MSNSSSETALRKDFNLHGGDIDKPSTECLQTGIVPVRVTGARLFTSATRGFSGVLSNIDGTLTGVQGGDVLHIHLEGGAPLWMKTQKCTRVLGIGQRAKIERPEIQWPQPSGKVETFTNVRSIAT